MAREAAWTKVPPSLERRFSIVEPFASGGTGSLYLADEPETGRRGLLKILPPVPKVQLAERQRMRRELVKQATLSTVHVAVPLATGENEGSLWVFREWIDGISLRLQLFRHGALPEADSLGIAAQLATALDELHRAGLLHRALKPEHVLLTPSRRGPPRVTLIDAGIGRPVEGLGTTVVMGTPGYVAPEQLQGKLVSFRSDLYALGSVMYEMVTGRPAFDTSDVSATLAAQLKGELPPLPETLPHGIGPLLQSLLARDPQERPFSAQKLRRTLDPFLPDGTPVIRQATLTASPLQDDQKPSASGGTMRPPPPPPPRSPAAAPVTRVPSRVPPPVPTARSAPPPPPVKSADVTQQIQLEQIMEMGEQLRVSAPKKTAPPPPKREAPRPVEPPQVMSVAKAPPPPPKSEPEKPSPDMTQPVRLDQILDVVQSREPEPKPTTSAPPGPPLPSIMVTPQAASSQPALAPVQPAAAPVPPAVAPVQQSAASIPSLAAAPSPDLAAGEIDVETEDDAVDEDAAATVVAARPPRQAGKKQHAIDPLIEALSDDIDDSSDDLPPPRKRERASAGELLDALPPPQITAPRGSDAPPRQSGRLGPDSGQLTLPHESSAIAREVARQQAEAEQHTHKRMAHLPQQKRAVYAGVVVAAVALLGFALGQLVNRGETAAAKQPESKSESVAAASGQPTANAPGKPLAKAPVGATEGVVVQPVVAAPAVIPAAPAAAAPAVVQVGSQPAVVQPLAVPSEPVRAEPAPAAVVTRDEEADEEVRSRRSTRSERRASKASAPAVNNEALWAQARDEARQLYTAKRYKQAADAYARAAKYNPGHAGTWAGLGASRANANDPRGAIQAYQKAIKISPSTSGFHAALGRAYVTAGDSARAKAAYKKALALDPNNAAAKAALVGL